MCDFTIEHGIPLSKRIKHHGQGASLLITCAWCKIEKWKRLGEIKKTKNNFCSRSCAAKYNNITKPKRSLKKTCKLCAEKISSDRTYCNKCWNKDCKGKRAKDKCQQFTIDEQIVTKKYMDVTTDELEDIFGIDITGNNKQVSRKQYSIRRTITDIATGKQRMYILRKKYSYQQAINILNDSIEDNLSIIEIDNGFITL